MVINKIQKEDSIVLAPEGFLDTANAPAFETEMEAASNETKNLIVDFAKVEYISSSGLRVLLKIQKKMNGCGSQKLINVSDNVKEVFELTGFVDILDIA
ncbi:anti-sigma B factor antagonist [Fibrobacter sp. UWH9]|uniref:STAS domain-containing protein n=1 Tax=unclassified Fibrobacter TaxID=2634177 RepID=UPI00091829D6|nr:MULTISPECIES: STAS domain-containing protein [Fibrobacter]MCQ2099928.1 STAS domain-containing protein [Fibrobacter sp.]MCL4102163.1 putative anti-sigma factor antagonist BtrV [Fibrobacter succinogenes]MDO4946135.1 STAS domain-containing protein [Fibrobacter sp.]OWV04755.1 hypothetical protein B7993_10100 [Fibrobacter sp. UWH3]OWV13868.1 hypothetical protein B7992_07870 [Fibrobacter sp. UWH1]